MLKIILTTLITISTLVCKSQTVEYLLDESSMTLNNTSYSQKSVDLYKKVTKPQTFSGFLKIGMGISPTHSRAFAEWQLGASYKLIELSIGALPSVSKDNIHVLDARIGLRFPINKMFNVTPNIGYWTFWNGTDPVELTDGNRFVYGVDLDRRIHDNLNLVASWIDCRSHIPKMNGMKIGSIGLRYIF